ncbi:MAG: SDR family NAD(P)-dependent oxidoreductase [Cellvibrionales bacterium]|nr:SDR family NAD(P)-dependent oxidoreductase [Cellvibrionales bacterium]
MPAIQNETIWLTGASSGLGLALCHQLAAQGNRLIISARNTAALHALAAEHPGLIPLPLDIADPKAVTAASQQLQQHTDHLDRLILNAGTCEYLDPARPDPALMTKIAEINYLGQMHCIAASLDLLKQAKAPHIVGISSQVIHAAFPRAAAYGASKAAMDYALRSLWLDLAPHNIDLTLIRPGFVDTPLTRRNQFAMPFLMSADRAAQRCLRAIARRKHCYSFPKRLRLLLRLLNACLPALRLKLLSGPAPPSSTDTPKR